MVSTVFLLLSAISLSLFLGFLLTREDQDAEGIIKMMELGEHRKVDESSIFKQYE